MWRDPLILWDEHPFTLGQAHPNFIYPDPLGSWSEIRRWAVKLVRLEEQGWRPPTRTYEGFWGRTGDGRVVGKGAPASPHPQPLPVGRRDRLPAVGPVDRDEG